MKKLFSILSVNSIIRYILATITIILILASQTTAQVIGTGTGNHTLAVKADGTVYTWGYNLYGQLGNGVSGSSNNSNVPVAVVDGDSNFTSKIIIAVATGNYHSIALTSDGKVYTWGYNQYGQLGNGESGTFSNVPIAVADGDINFTSKTIIAIAAGSYHSIALDSDGKIYTWGRNNYGQLGNEESGAGTNSNIPVAILNGDIASKTITAIAAGVFHSIVLDSDGKVYTWGYNTLGQLGTGNTSNSNVPVAVVNGAINFTSKTITAVAAGFYHSIALDSDGKAYSWGYNASGQLGNGNLSDSNVPIAVVDGAINFTSKTITAVATGFDHSIALDSDGNVYTWGYNQYGQLGNGVSGGGTNSEVPVAVADGDISFTSKNITTVAAGSNHSIALDSDGNVYSWGYNFDGQLGNGVSGSGTNSNVPVSVDQSSMGALPVELISFTVSSSDGNVTLNWQTATEVNNYGFEIERAVFNSQSSIPNWTKIGFVKGNGTTNYPKEYSFTDTELPNADEVSYRLKQIDNDGTFAFSKTLTVDLSNVTDVEDNINYQFALEQNYPNPFNPVTSIRFTVPSSESTNSISQKTKLVIYNALGQVVSTIVDEQKSPGNYEVLFDASNLSSGIYFYKLTTHKFSQIKKMILLK